MLKLKPTERLILLALAVTPNQTRHALCTSTGVSKPYNVQLGLRVLLAANLITESGTPSTYNLAPLRPAGDQNV